MPINFDESEKRFESDIEQFLISEQGGYEQFTFQNPDGHRICKYYYDKEKAIYPEVFVNFIIHTQPKVWEKYVHFYGDNAQDRLYRQLEQNIANNGLIYVLRHGFKDMGTEVKVCYFKPESELNEKANELYKQNILGVTRQFAYSTKNNNTIDMVLSLNGIPVVAIELKNQFKGQTYENAIKQFKNDRDPREFCFRLNHRFLVYFAADLYEAWMTTYLNGSATRFFPFNQGSGGAGKTGGKGNPENPDGYSTSYLWEQVLQRDSLLNLIQRYISLVKEKEEVESGGSLKIVEKTKLLFPRYHQYDAVNKIIENVRENGAGQSYLIEHSAGSGKSNTIAWTAYRLASLHNDENNAVFDSVIVVTNRIVLDSQLQDTINSFEHQAGLVEAIDDKKKSKGLIDAINDKKRIIICTIQKFLFAYKEFDNLSGRRFAVIIDEAHQGQSGESAKTLRKALVDMKLAVRDYAEEEGIDEAEVDLTDDLVNVIMHQGKHANQSFFAFTATPKNKTLELFGTRNTQTGIYEPFHTYSMRQAIEEGFILNVLANYTTIKEAFKIVRTSQENPELVEGEATKALIKYYRGNGFTISQKTDMIMSNFLDNGRFQINGKGKAMIVADSRINAVRYYQEVNKYLDEHPDKAAGCGVLVAFSGTVKLDGLEYTEAGLNVDSDGNSINTDKKFRKAFKSSKYNIMVVADKYQTGFDEPLLHSMYVDKALHDISAVQTLSRLNRTCAGKESTFVLDFVNDEEAIKKSFQPYYEQTTLKGETDYNKIYALRTKISNYLLYNSDDVEKFYKLMTSQQGKQSTAALGQLGSLFKPIIERYCDYDTQEERFDIRMAIRNFVKSYSYITQIVRLHDEELFKEYLFDSHLIKLLPVDKVEIIPIADKISLEYASLTKSFEGAIILDKKSVELLPSADKKKTRVIKKDTLQSIIDKVNDRFAGEFTDSDRNIVESIYSMFMNDDDVKKYKSYAKNTSAEMFVKSLFPDKFKDIAVRCFTENSESFQKLFNDSEFYQKVMEAMANELYKNLRKD